MSIARRIAKFLRRAQSEGGKKLLRTPWTKMLRHDVEILEK